MRILVHDHSGHSFQVHLSRWLAKSGHQVLHVYSSSFQTPKGNLVKVVGDPDELHIHGISLKEEFQKYSFAKRRFQEVEYGRLLVQTLNKFAPGVVISSNTPLDVQSILWKACHKRNIPKIFWVQDIYSIAIRNILSAKLSLPGQWIGRYYQGLEQKLLRQSQGIVLITEDFLSLMEAWKVSRDNIHIIPNWAPIQEIPVLTKTNPWSQAQGLNESFVFLYSGTLGKKHNPQILLELAKHFALESQVKIVVISEGLGATWLQEQKKMIALPNLMLMNFQPFDVLPAALASADVLIALLESDAGVYSVPSKILSYLCAGRAMLLAIPKENLAARIVETQRAGQVVAPSEVQQFLNAARVLYNDESLRRMLGINAREYAKRTFDIDKIGQQFQIIIDMCVKKQRGNQ